MRLKSLLLAPAIPMLLIVKEPKPMLVSVTVPRALLVPTGWVPKNVELGERLTPGTSAAFTDKFAIAIPLPTVRELKPAFDARAVLFITLVTCERVREGLPDSTSAAMAAAVGAAAEVPQKGLNPGTADSPQSAAVKSTLGSVAPPFVLKRKLLGVIAVPFGL